jgi:hypothetical protein
MKSIFFALFVFINTTTFAGPIIPDFSKACTASNGWHFNVDYYWDGHPQGPGGVSGIVQIESWGKFPVTMIPDGNDLMVGFSHGPDRLSSIEIKFSINEQYLMTREMLALGNYTEWHRYRMECK